jgi:hypothetical protein
VAEPAISRAAQMKRNDPTATPEWLAEARRFLNSHLEVLRGLQNAAADRAQKYLLFTNAGAVVATLSYIGASSAARSQQSVWIALSLFVTGVILCGLLAAISYHGTAGDMQAWITDMDRFFGDEIDLQQVPSHLNKHLNKWNRAATITGYLAFLAFVVGSATAIPVIATASRPPGPEATPQHPLVPEGPAARLPHTEPQDWWMRVVTDPNAEFAGMVALFTLALVFVGGIQAWHLQRTVRAAQRQSFDNAFFQLLQRFSEVVKSVDADAWTPPRPDLPEGDSRPVKGRKAIEVIYTMIMNSYSAPAEPDQLAAIVTMHKDVYQVYEPELGPYFRTLYHVFKFIDHSRSLADQEKIDYANVARAQLSRFELALIFYNCLTPYGTKFKPLIETYGILKHVNQYDLADRAHRYDERLYRRTAFMSQEERDNLT